MNFKAATDELFEGVSHSSLAKCLGVSVSAIRQARLSEGSKAFRNPPKKWRNAIIRLAEEKVWHYRKLIEQLRATQEDQ
jgi:hypothetical protein